MAAPGPLSQEPLPPDNNAERARAAARESASWLRDEAGRLYDNYSKQSKFFKWRSWIIGGFVLVTLASLFFAAPPLNTLDGARVVPKYDTNDHFIVSIENESADPWTDVRVVLDGQFEYRKDTVPAGESILAPIAQFTAVDNRASKAPVTFQPRMLKISADQGSFKQDVSPDE